MDMLGAQNKEDILGRYIYDLIDLHYQELALKRLNSFVKKTNQRIVWSKN